AVKPWRIPQKGPQSLSRPRPAVRPAEPMTRMYLWRLSLVAVLACMGAPATLRAQESTEPPDGAASADAPADPNAVTEPKLLAFVDAGYPEEARAEQLEAQVLLVLTIGTDGFVEDAQLA